MAEGLVAASRGLAKSAAAVAEEAGCDGKT
jgi:hypothetical protein